MCLGSTARHVRGIVAVPVLVLPARQGMQVDDSVKPMPRKGFDGPVEAGESCLGLEMAVVHRDPYRVEPERGQQRRVRLAEEPVKELVEERLVGLIPHGLPHEAPDVLLAEPEAALFVDFLVNSTEAGNLILTDRGLPMSPQVCTARCCSDS